MQQTYEDISGESLAEHVHLTDFFEIARRFSGLIAIAVLVVATITMAVRAEFETPPTIVYAAPAAVSPVQPAADTATVAAANRGKTMVLHVDPPTIVYYLYETDEAYRLVQQAEAMSAQETNENYPATSRQFIPLRAATAEEEQAARDTIYEAMLTHADGSVLIIVRDLRDLEASGAGE